MDTILIGMIKSILLPPAGLVLLILAALWLQQKRRAGAATLMLFSLFTWYILSIPVIANILIKSIETYPPLKTSQISEFKPQAIVVLGGGIRIYAPEFGSEPTVNYKTLERLRYAARLARETKLPILVSGGKVFEYDRIAEAEAMSHTLTEDFGISARWQENLSHNTAENARFSFSMLNQFNITRILLVTHALHMPRAIKAFKASGFELLPAATGYWSDYSETEVLYFFPSANALMQSSIAIYEYLGDLWMRLKSMFT